MDTAVTEGIGIFLGGGPRPGLRAVAWSSSVDSSFPQAGGG